MINNCGRVLKTRGFCHVWLQVYFKAYVFLPYTYTNFLMISECAFDFGLNEDDVNDWTLCSSNVNTEFLTDSENWRSRRWRIFISSFFRYSAVLWSHIHCIIMILSYFYIFYIILEWIRIFDTRFSVEHNRNCNSTFLNV